MGTVEHGNIIEPIRSFLGASSTFVQATATRVDLERRTVACLLPTDALQQSGLATPPAAAAVAVATAPTPNGAGSETSSAATEFEFDRLVIAVGARPADFGIPGVLEHAFFLKELDHSAVLQQRLLSCLEHASALDHVGRQVCTFQRSLLSLQRVQRTAPPAA